MNTHICIYNLMFSPCNVTGLQSCQIFTENPIRAFFLGNSQV